tara:strand:+ start:2902 stop:3192 length:291 start_codon:yes stop_codon:yes gene_type:complete
MSFEEYMKLGEERIERTANAWDKMAESFFERHGWTKSHMAYSTERATKTLWVMTQDDPEVWEDTGISAKKADRLLCEGWDTAELIGYEEWIKEMKQ